MMIADERGTYRNERGFHSKRPLKRVQHPL